MIYTLIMDTSKMFPLPDYYYYLKSEDDENCQTGDDVEEQTQREEEMQENQKILANRLNKLKEQCEYLKKEESRVRSKFEGNLNNIELSSQTDLEAQVKQFRLSREYLPDVNWKSQVIILPDIFVTQYSDRFKFDDYTRTIRMVNRVEKVETYFNEINQVRSRNYNMYFYGCSGVGKSFLIYQLSCRLMSQAKNVVVYVPLCFFDIVLQTLRTLYVSCKSYQLESIDKVLDDEMFNLKNIIIKRKEHEYEPSFVLKVIEKVEEELRKVGRQLIFVIDQTNFIMNDSDSDEYKKQILFVNMLLEKYIVIAIGTANNELQRIKISYSSIKYEHCTFNSDEFLAFLAVKSMTTTSILGTDTIESILDLTGEIPYEINRFVPL